jgi:hypothetical protein
MREGQTGKYQPRKGYGLRLRDVRDHDGEFWAAFFSAMILLGIGTVARLLGLYPLAMALGTVALWTFLVLAVLTVRDLLKGR